ncbi:AAA family ATPase [Paraburkholderia pallida]|uniref:histidine kinase n=1 Tax=Paraburkholderia pallida TaxID=2547399 RepID=A0A4P7D6G8_9BURK|nr:AAA family ATPase [Paraburkholderia pallida]QBR03738.1 PAS domain S-box protein [Paraburkholderia pallida]
MDLTGYELEPLHDDGDFSLFRARQPGNPVSVLTLVATRTASRSIARLEHEYTLASMLDSAWAVRPLALHAHSSSAALVLEDNGGEPLDRTLGQPLELPHFLNLAVKLTKAVGQLHRHGLIHKDIKPANVFVDGSGNVRLTGFGIASRLPHERQQPAPPEIIAGTFPYMAPEQTGRMNRSIDARSDLYSLGVTLYEMLTGSLPFVASDAMEWIHCHIARKPTPPSTLISGIPQTVEAIVLKLLAKTAEDRYQTAAGVETDLLSCFTAWETFHRIDPFPLGAHDASDHLLIPEKLYGREVQIELLNEAFDRVVVQGTSELALISGYSGIGKTSVVNELHKVLVPPRGLFAAGKADQYKRDIPYATLAQAFQSLVRELLTKSDAEVSRWRHALIEALGTNGRLIVDLIPELSLIIGEPPQVPSLQPQDAKNRFQLVFRRFLSVFASQDHPLALFVDDLQWLDTATLDLIEHLITHPEVRHLLLVGAYRDNEVSSSHPLMRTLEAIRKAGGKIQETTLSPLTSADIVQLVADSLHYGLEIATPLAELVHQKTGGNPFFSIQFLTVLTDEGLLEFDYGALAWRCDMPRIRAKGFTENVADLMATKLCRLPDHTRDTLGQLSCLGNIADIATVTLVHGGSEKTIHEHLWEAVRAGLIYRVGGAYAFVHDRIQEAAYAQIPESERAAAHLRIGRLLVSRMAPDEIEEVIFDIANHLNRGSALITDRNEIEHVVEVNVIAGKRAKSSTAYASARNYLAQAISLLPPDSWKLRYEQTFDLYLTFSECEYLVGNFAEADALFDKILGLAHSDIDRAKAYSLRIKLYQVSGKYDAGVAVALEALRYFDMTFPESEHDINKAVDIEFREMWNTLGDRAIRDLVDAPVAAAPKNRAIIDLLVDVGPCAYIARPTLFPLVTLRAVIFSMRHGNTSQSSFAYGVFALALVSFFGDIASAFEFSEMSLKLNDKFNNAPLRGTLLHLHGDHVNFWRRHFSTGIPILERAFSACLEVGDLVYAGYLAFETIWQLIEKGDHLMDVLAQSTKYEAFTLQSHNDAVYHTIRLEQRFVASLQGKTKSPLGFDDETFDEMASFDTVVSATFGTGVVFYHIMKQVLAYLYGLYDDALGYSMQAEPLIGAAMALPMEATYYFYYSLTLTALYPAASSEKRQEYMLAINASLRKLKHWADNCPENFSNRYSLVCAEIARIEGRNEEAMRLYENAIRSAQEHGFIQNEGLAYELAARFYAANCFEEFAETYIQNARSCYARWGADGKVRQLDQIYPNLRQERPHHDSTITTSVEQLDLATVLKVSQVISSAIALGELIDTLMVLALEHAGGDRGLLIVPSKDGLRIEAEATTVGVAVTVRVRQTHVTSTDLPESILRYVIRTKDSVLLDDVSAQSQFSGDPYILHSGCRSILCLPLIKQSKLIGILYLENRLSSHVFTPGRLAILRLLASQAAVSWENARLFADLQHAQAFLADAQRLSHTGSFHWHTTTGDMFWSEESYRIFGYAPETKPTLELALSRVHPDELAGVQETIARATENKVGFDFEHRFLMPDGSVKYLHIVARAVTEEGGEMYFAGALMDITARKQANAALESSEHRYRTLFRDMPVALMQIETQSLIALLKNLRAQGVGDLSAYIDRHPNILQNAAESLAVEEVNNHAVLMFGAKDRSEMLGSMQWFWSGGAIGTLQRAMESRYRGETFFEETTKFRTLDGRIIDVLCTIGRPPISNDFGISLLGLVDITERVRSQEMLQRVQADFAHAARISVLGELTASIAHELTQPLAAIAANGEAGLHWLDWPVPNLEKLREGTCRIVADAVRAANIVARIRGMATRRAPERSPVSLNELILEALLFLGHEVESRGVTVSHDLAPGTPQVLADRVQIQQVIVNLAVNAMQAMADAGSSNRRITIRTTASVAATICCSVEDSGPGIADKYLKQIFDSFFTTKEGGMGMGLPISHSIIEAHGGRIAADNNSSHGGARVYFCLPYADIAP